MNTDNISISTDFILISTEVISVRTYFLLVNSIEDGLIIDEKITRSVYVHRKRIHRNMK